MAMDPMGELERAVQARQPFFSAVALLSFAPDLAYLLAGHKQAALAVVGAASLVEVLTVCCVLTRPLAQAWHNFVDSLSVPVLAFP
jgi:hypothetical protein